MADTTKLKLEYADRSRIYELPDDIEQALEDDYVQNSHLYTDRVLECIRVTFRLNSSITPEQILQSVRIWHQKE